MAAAPIEPFWYRRRRENTQKKQGNINDFVQRWGGRYEYMLELDADSFVSPEAMLELVRRMDARPRTALIQSLPIIVGARTYSARAQQLALRVHGGLFGAGLTWWSGGAGNFWGHNALHPPRAVRQARQPARPSGQGAARRQDPEPRLRRSRPAAPRRLARRNRGRHCQAATKKPRRPSSISPRATAAGRRAISSRSRSCSPRASTG
jgi:hypothetical protein